MSHNLELKELQKIELEILLWFDTFCKENNLHYFLHGGTLLGAVRHHGFIPWDDDVDVGMFREDYDKLCTLCKDKPDARYRFYAPETNKQYLYPMGKLVDTNTTLIENSIDCGVNLGVYIDIFPFDADLKNEEDRMKRRQTYLKHEKKLGFAMSRRHRGKGIKKVVVLGMDCAVQVVGRRRFTMALVRFAKKWNQSGSSLVNICSYTYNAKVAMEKDQLASTVDCEFEGHLLPIPAGYDEFLTKCYGDYLQLPPMENRVGHHDFSAVINEMMER